MTTAVLLSGGVDSLLCAELANRDGVLAGCVFVDYGHPSQIGEGWKAFSYAGSRGIPLLAPHVRDLDLGAMQTGKGACVVPARNAILLSVAANAARRLGAQTLTIGANAADQRDYPDCRPAFFAAMSQALGMQIRTPLLEQSKAEIIEAARRCGLERSDCWSCYAGGCHECGSCASCVEANAAWLKL